MASPANSPSRDLCQSVERLKADERYFEAGQLAKAQGLPRQYGCHYGMRSGRQAAIAEFCAGYDKPATSDLCQCQDPQCPVCHGGCDQPATTTLARVDMDGAEVRFCRGCADDAWTSGLYDETDQPGNGVEHEPSVCGLHMVEGDCRLCNGDPEPARKPVLAYWDCWAGLVPCRVLAVDGEGNASVDRLTACDAVLRLEITADRGPYKRGEQLTAAPFHVWSRAHCRRKRGSFGRWIVRPHDWRELLSGDQS